MSGEWKQANRTNGGSSERFLKIISRICMQDTMFEQYLLSEEHDHKDGNNRIAKRRAYRLERLIIRFSGDVCEMGMMCLTKNKT